MLLMRHFKRLFCMLLVIGLFIGTSSLKTYADALVAGQLCSAPIILVEPGDTENAAIQFIKERSAGTDAPSQVYRFCGYAAKSSSFREVCELINAR